MTNSGLQMDYDVELSGDMFRVKGDLLFAGSNQLPYVLVNATLGQGERAIVTTRYLMMQIEPGRECGFEICKSCSLSAGEYNCVLSVEAPEGVIAEDVRKVSLAQGQSGIGEWSEAEEAAFWRMIEENEREEDEGREDFGEAVKRGRGRDASEEDEGRVNAEETDAGARVEGDGASRSDESGRATLEAEETEEVSEPEGGSMEPSSGDMAEDGRAGSISEGEGLPVGSITSKKYHRPDCRYAQKIKPENLISFRSIDDARGQGYIPCKVCNP